MRFSQNKPGKLDVSYVGYDMQIRHGIISYHENNNQSDQYTINIPFWTFELNGIAMPEVYPTLHELIKECKVFGIFYPNYPKNLMSPLPVKLSPLAESKEEEEVVAADSVAADP